MARRTHTLCHAGTYLETALASGAADPAVYEQELAKIYLERVVGSAAPLAAPPLAAPPLGTAAGSAAAGSAAASSSPAAAAAAAVGRPPAQALPEEYGKLKKLVGGGCRPRRRAQNGLLACVVCRQYCIASARLAPACMSQPRALVHYLMAGLDVFVPARPAPPGPAAFCCSSLLAPAVASTLQILASRHLDYEALLRVVPQQGLLELRAALLERLGRWGLGWAGLGWAGLACIWLSRSASSAVYICTPKRLMSAVTYPLMVASASLQP